MNKVIIFSVCMLLSFVGMSKTLQPSKYAPSRCQEIEFEKVDERITITQGTEKNDYFFRGCQRFYDSLQCTYYTSENNRSVMIDDFCSDGHLNFGPCLYIEGCDYLLF